MKDLTRKKIEKFRALRMRSYGYSVKEIARKVGVSQSTVSLWVRDIELTPAQVERLLDNKRENGRRVSEVRFCKEVL